MKEVFQNITEENLEPILSSLDRAIDSFKKNNNNSYPIILLTGSMGAGKTTFVRRWFERFESTSKANSPTFSLYNIYESNKGKIFHFDLYRIQNRSEFDELGFEEIWGRLGLCLIEWWQKADHIIPKDQRIYVNIEFQNLQTRDYTLEWVVEP